MKKLAKKWFVVIPLDEDDEEDTNGARLKVCNDLDDALYDAECEVGKSFRKIELCVVSDAKFKYSLVPIKERKRNGRKQK